MPPGGLTDNAENIADFGLATSFLSRERQGANGGSTNASVLLAFQLEIGRPEAFYATGLMIRRIRGSGAEAKDLVQIPL